MNLLVDRLKYAKRELTALKTAHKRGLGNLKVYTQEVTITHPGGSQLLNLVVNFDNTTVAYPFVRVIGSMNSSYTYNLNVLGAGYTNNGKTYKMTGTFILNTGMNKIYVESTLPASSISYTWGR